MKSNERGQVAILVVGLALISFLIVGVAVDGTRAFLHRRALQNAADSAVLAAASEIDRPHLYGETGSVRLSATAATSTVEASLKGRGLRAESAVNADGGTVSVLLRSTVRTSFLRLLGIAELPVAVEAAARPMP